MVFVFDENFSHWLVTAMHFLEQGNQFRTTTNTEVYHILKLAEELQYPKIGASYKDDDVIKMTASKSGILLTHDDDFRRIKHLSKLFKANNVGVFFFQTHNDSRGYWNMVNNLIKRWPEIKEKAENTVPPFYFCIKKTGIHQYSF
ncbi:MAG: hypothetical protein ABI763_09460 [Bacteroidota bacterium]